MAGQNGRNVSRRRSASYVRRGGSVGLFGEKILTLIGLSSRVRTCEVSRGWDLEKKDDRVYKLN